ncbi:MAG: energy transducer TonB [Xanthomonadales bacterium]|nr:energy transducer TonB [Xanthomonadales bacterium]MBK7146304.1 energy transducer TonB [Xanthomonadales bacterium]MCC6563153.1 energy transducer TonB [Xanthomonadales bacterium]
MLFSAILHAIVILGVSFDYEDPAAYLPSLDVILVQSAAATQPNKADFLANASQQGGGESEESKRPRQPVTSPIPKPTDGLAPMPQRAGAPKPQQATPKPALHGSSKEYAVQRVDEPRVATPEVPQVSARELIEHSLEMARLAAELERQTEAYAKRPKRKFISASTREYAFAAYMRSWVAKIERIGNLNYPDEARRKQVHGGLVLTVAVNRDGSVERIDIIQSSGNEVLDQAAIRIVELGAPFSPLPASNEQIDILHITRTWQFLDGTVTGK